MTKQAASKVNDLTNVCMLSRACTNLRVRNEWATNASFVWVVFARRCCVRNAKIKCGSQERNDKCMSYDCIPRQHQDLNLR